MIDTATTKIHNTRKQNKNPEETMISKENYEESNEKKIGVKTTRIRALQGEEIVISNKELTSTRIQNFKKMICIIML